MRLRTIAAGTALALIAAMAGGGCETIGQDFSEVASAINPTTPAEAAKMMVDPYDADNRRRGTVLISNAPWGGVEVYVTAYRDMVDHERDPIVKGTAIRALARHGAPEDALRIIPHLSHENPQVRWEAAKGLQRLHNRTAVTDLLRVLRDEVEQADVRIAAATGLAQYPEDRVFQGLVAALEARELAVNAAAQRSLVTLTGQAHGLDARRWLQWYNTMPSPEHAFAGRQEYLFPTYHRDDTIWEKLTFWSSRNFEQPAAPAGLRPKSERSTYGDEQTETPQDATESGI